MKENRYSGFGPFGNNFVNQANVNNHLSKINKFIVDSESKGDLLHLILHKSNRNCIINAVSIREKQNNGPLYPMDIFSLDMKKELIGKYKEEMDNKTLKDTGKLLYNIFIPTSIQKYINNIKPSKIIIITATEHDIPWELIFDGTNFWCEKYVVARYMGNFLNYDYLKLKTIPKKNKINVLIIADPKNDTHSAKEEGFEISKLLHNSSINIKIIGSAQATKVEVCKNINSNMYEIIHYAGHADFNIENPKRSSLHLKDGKLTYENIKCLSLREKRPLIFINACSSSDNKFIGNKSVGLALAFMEAGCMAFIGSMYPIESKVAAKFASIFYKNLQKFNIGESLRKARWEMKCQHKIKDCQPFTLYGDPSNRLQ